MSGNGTGSKTVFSSETRSSKSKASSMLPVLLLLLLPYVLQSASVGASNNRTDVDSLLAFKASLSNKHGVLAAWNTTTDYCQWPGIGCSLKHKHRVTVLNLSSEVLGGTITPSIGNLSFLRILDLRRNNLQGNLPASLVNSTEIFALDVSFNNLIGRLPPEIGMQCPNFLSLGPNQFMATTQQDWEFMTLLTNCTRLSFLNLQGNRLGGVLPSSVANLSTQLQSLYVEGNEISGEIPFGIGNLVGLNQLELADNLFIGALPDTIGMLSSLQFLDLGYNLLTGFMPSSLGNLTQLLNLYTDNNTFEGPLPASLGRLPEITAATFSNNKFTGPLPKDIFNLSSLSDALDLSGNYFVGPLPPEVGGLTKLAQLYLSQNNLSGALPNELSNCQSLTELGLDDNSFDSTIPSSISKMRGLMLLNLTKNTLSGVIPQDASLGRLPEITSATFSNNKFTGPLPKDIFNISSLADALDLSSNFFLGPLPPEVGDLTKLARLYLSHNNLSGPLPGALSNCQSLTELRLDDNSFDSSIPSSINKMRGLMLLNLTKNTLSGLIPKDLGLMGGLEQLYLAHNNLSGHIPESLENMASLYQLDLSFNLLDGKVPLRGVFSNASGFSFGGNLRLCGGIVELRLPACKTKSVGCGFSKRHLTITLVTAIAGVILILSLMLVFLTMRMKSKTQSTTTGGFQLMDDSHPRVTYVELVQGTSGFAVNNLLGRGRYGSVYKCCLLLKNMMTTVAVKVFDLQQSGSFKSFQSECEALSKIRHRNLISVITCCSSSDLNQNDFKAIVFEFMPNGSLDRWLHMDVHVTHLLQGLTLMQRLNITVDIADALDYLHNNCEPPIIHCDLKPSNILLNEDLVAHVGDFGLAKILPESTVEQLINSKSSVGIRGTIGYVAPEYGEGGQVSSCGDVYSFGTVILELFTGMAPTHDMFRDGLTLQKHAENAFPGMLMQIANPALLSIEEANANSLQDGSNTMEHAIFSVMKVALSCSRHAPTERMCIRDAAAAIHRIRDGYVKARQNEGVVTAAYTARHFAETTRAAP
ncbi:putative receptor-like protein kinase At3g47110 isoform X2 [Triticum aestivum]|uniref:putative receptor-like protein kinase At3g47110 isoform X2 n=1 Tax=Triticum aestivum TaxID=4565 RepID=UPI001D032DED|nr:putative receptor-like protein kinase At3g47110 isoform X2 [Triticum aestivum]